MKSLKLLIRTQILIESLSENRHDNLFQSRTNTINQIFMDPQQLNIKFENYEQISRYAAETNKVLVVLDDYVLDATTFAQHHPGGAGLIHSYRNKNINQTMKFHHPLTLKMANSLVVGSFKKQIDRIIDPTKPLMDQIWNIGHQDYIELTNSPHWLFVPSPRMFQSNFCQFFSHNKWYHILILPYLVCALLFYSVDSWDNFSLGRAIITAILGVLLFSLTEYVLHRFLFHSEHILPNNKLMRYLHYMMHGIHHMLPNDPDRLVFPPFLAVIACTILYHTLVPTIGITDQRTYAVFWSFFLIGYTMYDCIHYSLHHVDTSTMKGSYLHQLQRYHNQHHYGGQDAGYGVSSPIWDFVFRTGFKNDIPKKDL